VAQARATLEATAGRTAELLDSIPDGNLPVTGSQWTVGEVGAYLVAGLGVFTQAAAGSFDGLAEPGIRHREREKLGEATRPGPVDQACW
jgi:hypothetical protein